MIDDLTRFVTSIIRLKMFLVVCLSLNNQIIRLLYDLNRANQAVIESLQNRCALEGMWHPPEENYLNVFDTRKFDLIKDENRRKGYCNA